MVGALEVFDADRLAPRWRREYLSLREESDADFRNQSFLTLADRMEQAENPDLAARVYQFLATEPGADRGLQVRAQERLAALQGRAGFGVRLEHNLQNFGHGERYLPGIVGLALGASVFQLMRGAAFAGLAESSLAPILGRRGIGAIATLAGGLAELPVITGIGSLGQDSLEWRQALAANALSLGLMRASSAIFAPRGRLSAQLGLFGGTWLGLGLQETFGLAGEPSGGARAADALTLGLQFQIAAHLGTRAFGARFGATDIESRPRTGQYRFGNWMEPLYASSDISGPRRVAPALPAKGPVVMMMSSDRPSSPGLSAASNERMLRFRKLFTVPGNGEHVDGIIQAVMGIAPPYPRFHERLLEAMAQVPDSGSRAHFLSARAFEWLFQTNPVRSSIASYDHALLQEYLQEALKLPEPTPRQQAIADLLTEMRSGLTRLKLDGLFHKHGVGKELKIPPPPFFSGLYRSIVPFKGPEDWQDYRPEDRWLLSRFIAGEAKDDLALQDSWNKVAAKGRTRSPYPAEDVNAVLDFARESPLGKLAMRRLLQIFAVRDLPEKVREILPSSRESDSAAFIGRMENIRMNPVQIASRIEGSAHTAFLKHPLLAHKVTTVMLAAERLLSEPAKRQAATQRLEDAIRTFFHTGRRLTEADVLALLEVNPHPIAAQLKDLIKDKSLILQVSAEHPGPNRLSSSSDSVFLIPESDPKKVRILIRQLPAYKRNSADDERAAQSAIVKRLTSLVHEFEHWKLLQSAQRDSDPLRNPNAKANRHELLANAILTDIEEEGWRIANGQLETWDLARQLGSPLALYLRDRNDAAMFRRENERRLADLASRRTPVPSNPGF